MLKDKGFTINGVKKFLINERSFDLDENSNRTIKTSKNNLKSKEESLSNLKFAWKNSLESEKKLNDLLKKFIL